MYERDYKTSRCQDCEGPCSRGAERCRSCREKYRWRNPDDPRRVPPYPLTPDDPEWPKCQCGCGQLAPARKANDKSRGFTKGEPCKYVNGHSNRSRIKPVVDGKKHCPKCNTIKPVAEFNKSRARLSGLDSHCRACISEKHRRYHAENRELRTVKSRAWRQANPEAVKAIHRRHTAKPEFLAKARIYSAARRARERDQFVEDVDATVVFDRDEGICGICGDPALRDDFHVDHIIPLSRGGDHSYANTQVAHPVCNSRKHNKLPEEYLNEQKQEEGPAQRSAV